MMGIGATQIALWLNKGFQDGMLSKDELFTIAEYLSTQPVTEKGYDSSEFIQLALTARIN